MINRIVYFGHNRLFKVSDFHVVFEQTFLQLTRFYTQVGLCILRNISYANNHAEYFAICGMVH